MKKVHGVIVLALVCVWCGCANQQKLSDSLNENNMSSTKLIQNTADNKMNMSVSDAGGEEKQEPVFVPGSFKLIGGRPFMLQDGAAYCQTEDKQWERYGDWENLVKLYREEYFVALDSEGAIICEDYSDAGEAESMPLTSACVAGMKSRMLELGQEYGVKALNKGGGEDWRALLEDGRVMVDMLTPDGNYAYQETSIDGEKIADIAGSYALTDSGKVYKGTINSRNAVQDKNGDDVMESVVEQWFVWEPLNADKSIISISASETSGICAGLSEDGTVVLWLPEKTWGLDVSEWENVSELSVGYNYVLGLTAGGEVLYAAADKDSETNIKKLLQDKKDIIQIACAYQNIALLHQDGTAEMIDLDD